MYALRMPGPRIYRLAIESHESGVAIATVLHVKADPLAPLADPNFSSLIGECDSWLSSAYRAMLSDEGTLDTLTLTETRASSDDSVPPQAVHVDGGAGTRSASGFVPTEVCAWVHARTNAAVRSGHGGFFGTPTVDSTVFSDTGGTIQTPTQYYIRLAAFTALLLAGHGIGLGGIDGHLSYVIYSQTRRDRGDAEWYFDVAGATIDRHMHFLRSRRD